MRVPILLILTMATMPAAAKTFAEICGKSACWTEEAEKPVEKKEKPTVSKSVPVANTAVKAVIGKIHKVTYEEINKISKALIGQTQRDIECLAYSMYREAGNQSIKDQYAVGQVHINRLLKGSWGKSMCQVVYAKAQFSWTLLPKKAPTWSNFDRSIYMTLAENMMVDGYRVKSLASTTILHYHAYYVNPAWAKKSQVVAHAGAHIFYKGIAH